MRTKSQRRRWMRNNWRARKPFKGPQSLKRGRKYYIWSDALQEYATTECVSDDKEMDAHQVNYFFSSRYNHSQQHWYRLFWDKTKDWRVVKKLQQI